MKFDMRRDKDLIAAGTHFWCKVCCVARPFREKSPDPKYCRPCYNIIQAEVPLAGRRKGQPDAVSRVVEDLPDNINGYNNANQVEFSQKPIIKHPGRPRATGPYLSRTTRWRRMKESLKKQETLNV